MTQQNQKHLFLKVLPILLIMLAIIIAVSMVKSKPKIKSRPVELVAPLIEAIEVTLETVQVPVKSQGTVEAKQKTRIISEVSGRIIWVSEKFRNGLFISKGEELLHIDAVNYEAALAVAKAELRNAELNLMEEKIRSRQAEMDWKLAQKLNSQGNKQATALTLRKPYLARALARVEANKAQLKLANSNLQRTRITASFNGIIEDKSVELGQYMALGSTVASLLSSDEAEVRLPLSPDDLNMLENDGLNAPVKITLPGRKSHISWPALISHIENKLDPVTRLRYAIASIQDPYNQNKKYSQALPLGTFINASIQGKFYDQVARIPRSALHQNHSLFIVDNSINLSSSGTLYSRPVNFINLDDTVLIVTKGLSEGEKVVLTRLPLMTNDMQVRISTESNLHKGSH